jgi:hypothetical protein
MTLNRPFAVIDTDTLLYSFKLQCPPTKRVIEKIDSQFEIYLPEKVFEEYKNKLSKGQLADYDDIRAFIDVFFKKKRQESKLIGESEYFDCLTYVRRYYCLKGKQREFEKLGQGEIHCIALGLSLSRKIKNAVFVFSDDFKAIDAGMGLFVYTTCFSSIRPLLEAMVFTFSVSNDIPELMLRNLVKEYFTINNPKKAKMIEYQNSILEIIGLSCRAQKNCSKISCQA